MTIEASAIQSDGNIVVAGFCRRWPGKFRFCRCPVPPAGIFDNSFDGDGRVTTDIGPGTDEANAVVIQNDGKIVVADSQILRQFFAIARYNSDGTLDTSFSVDGKETTAFTTRPVRLSALPCKATERSFWRVGPVSEQRAILAWPSSEAAACLLPVSESAEGR